ncbi:MAG: adenine phosphoribosyltransferase [Phycisphaeraceae bacterium]|nr:adenine phosphoribosyltransferase [Phycisphaerales bacterium]MCB9858960.1 adenine phosphoribosyltransferase [Phycisphaeraceae bacterium]
MPATNPTQHLMGFVRDVPDFPKPGIVFKDHTPLLADAEALALAVELMAKPWLNLSDDQRVQYVTGAESRGFIFGTAIARRLNAGFVPVRKPGKLPRAVRQVSYDLEYGSDALEIHEDALPKGSRVLIVDDLLATGGTLKACCELVVQAQAEIAGMSILIELCALNGASHVRDYAMLHTVLKVQ